jgi:hypothetical protein
VINLTGRSRITQQSNGKCRSLQAIGNNNNLISGGSKTRSFDLGCGGGTIDMHNLYVELVDVLEERISGYQ